MFIYYHNPSPWDITEDKNCIMGRTPMDNFNMYEFLKCIKVDMTKVFWEGAEEERSKRRDED